MNATDERDYIVAGLAELSAHLDALNRPPPSACIRSNTAARETARNRVWNVYGALGLTPPHQDALSITALRRLGYRLPTAEAAE